MLTLKIQQRLEKLMLLIKGVFSVKSIIELYMCICNASLTCKHLL